MGDIYLWHIRSESQRGRTVTGTFLDIEDVFPGEVDHIQLSMYDNNEMGLGLLCHMNLTGPWARTSSSMDENCCRYPLPEQTWSEQAER